jgi:hypothetical protein
VHTSAGETMHFRRRDREFEENAPDATMDELREFLEGDVMDVGADPKFKEALRKKLWDLVQGKMGGNNPRGSSD